MAKQPAPDRRLLFGGRNPKKGGEANSRTRTTRSLQHDTDKSEPRPSQSEGGAKPESNTGFLVGVRLQPDLLARLDRIIKPGQTRPQAIRELLEKYL